MIRSGDEWREAVEENGPNRSPWNQVGECPWLSDRACRDHVEGDQLVDLLGAGQWELVDDGFDEAARGQALGIR